MSKMTERQLQQYLSVKQLRWVKLVRLIRADTPQFTIRFKDESLLHRCIGKLMPWTRYRDTVTTVYPVVWYPSRATLMLAPSTNVLEHEWVHLKDAASFFGLLPNMPARLNALLFHVGYLFPQILALGALGAIWNMWCLLFLVFLAPWPAPFRIWAEIRAYKRTLELGYPASYVLGVLQGATYYWMWPFKNAVRSYMKGDSPYKSLMDEARSHYRTH